MGVSHDRVDYKAENKSRPSRNGRSKLFQLRGRSRKVRKGKEGHLRAIEALFILLRIILKSYKISLKGERGVVPLDLWGMERISRYITDAWQHNFWI